MKCIIGIEMVAYTVMTKREYQDTGRDARCISVVLGSCTVCDTKWSNRDTRRQDGMPWGFGYSSVPEQFVLL